MKYLLIALTMMISSITFASSSMAPKGKAEVDLSKSVVNWKGTKKITKDKHVGTMKLKSATIAEENGKLKSATVVMDLNSIDCTDLSGEWKQKFEGHIKSPDFLNTAKFPTATLNVTKVADGKMHGEMTILGTKNKVAIPFKKSGKTYTGKFTFDRTKYGMKYGSDNFFKNLGDKVIHNDVSLDFKVVLK